MLKPKRAKNKKKKSDEPQRKLLNREELIAQEAKFNMRMESVWETQEKIKIMHYTLNSGLRKKKKEEAWQKYLSCDGLPNPSNPIEIRKFLAKWQYYEDLEAEKRHSWVLKVNERSILTQDINAIDCTRKRLKALHEDHGHIYNDHIKRILTVLEGLRKVLAASQNIPSPQYVDLLKLKDVMMRTIQECIDTFTFRLIRDTAAHLNEFTKSFNMPETLIADKDFDKILVKEWEKRTELRNNEITEISRRVQQYEAEKTELEEMKKEQEIRNKKSLANAKGKPLKGGKKKAIKSRTFIHEPLKLDDNTLPDIEQEFWDFDDQEYLEFLNKCNYLLEEGEINLREHILMGGIYEFNFVEKPRQTNFPNLTMTWLEHPIVLKYKNKNCFLKTVDFSSLGIENRERGGTDAEDNVYNDDKKSIHSGLEFQSEEPPLTFFIISFKIPYKICKWQEPIVCQWYDVPKTMEETQEVYTNIDNHLEIRTPVIINDFVLSRTLEIPMMFHIINHLVPRFSSIHKFPEELNIEKRIATKKKFALEEFEIAEKEEKGEQIIKIPADRLFPIFKAIKPIVIIPMKEGSLTEKGIQDQTMKLFSDYVHELEHIKFTRLPQFKKGIIPPPSPPKKEGYLDDILSHKSVLSVKSIHTKKDKKKAKKLIEESTTAAAELLKNDEVKRLVQFFSPDEDHNSETDEGEGDEDFTFQANVESDKESVDSKVECSAEPIEYPKWSTKNIFKSEFDREKLQVRVWTNRLGVFAFAFKRYIHLPFRVWTIQPDTENNKIVKFYAESKYARICVDITEDGYNVQLLDYKMAKGLPIVIYKNEKPFTEIENLKKELQSIDINIFPERDAVLYIKRIPDKHLPLENHTYECIGLVCMFMQFCISAWNRVSGRRVIAMQCRSFEEDISALETIKITPEECQFVTIQELCTDLDQVVLKYNPTSRNLKYYPDLLSLINSSYFRVIANLEHEQMYNPKLQNNVIEFLKAVRPISFSR